MFELINSEDLKKEILSNCDLGQWSIQEVIKIIDNFPKISKLDIKDNDIVVYKFNRDFDYEYIQTSMYRIQDMLGSNRIIAITDDFEVFSQSSEETIVMLENLLKRIKRDISHADDTEIPKE